MSFDPDDPQGQLSAKPVINVFENTSSDVFEFAGVKVTGGHKYLTSSGKFKSVIQLTSDEKLVDSSGTKQSFAPPRKIGGIHNVYNFEVADLHTYVAGGYRVHNLNCDEIAPDVYSYWNDDGSNTTIYYLEDDSFTIIDTSSDKRQITAKTYSTGDVVEMIWERSGEESPYTVQDGNDTSLNKILGTVGLVLPNGDRLTSELTVKYYREDRAQEFRIETAGSIGAVFGSALGRHLAGDDPFAQIVASTVLGTLAENLAEAFFNGGFTVVPNLEAAYNVFDDFGDELVDAGVGAISSFLAAEFIDALGIEGFAGELATTAGGAVISTVINNVIDGNPIFDGVGGNIAGAVAGFLGSKLGHAIINVDSVEGQIGASIGGGIGSIIGGKIGILGVTGPVGIFIGAFIGTVLGGLLGNAFGGPARAGAMFLYNPDKDTFRTTSVWGKNGGDANAAKDLADVVTDSLNAILTAVDGEVVGGEYLHGNDTPLNGQVDFKNGELRYRTWKKGGELTEKISFTEGENPAEDFIEFAVFRMLKDMEIAGGNIYIKRALHRTMEQVLSANGSRVVQEDAVQILMGNLSVAADYQAYINDPFIINALMAIDPESAFTAGWLITLVRADEIGLNKRHWADHLGGWNYLLKDKDFAANDQSLYGNGRRDARAADVELDFVGKERVITITKANGQTEVIDDLVLGGDKVEIEFVTSAGQASDFWLAPVALRDLDAAVDAAIYIVDGSAAEDALNSLRYGLDYIVDLDDPRWEAQEDRTQHFLTFFTGGKYIADVETIITDELTGGTNTALDTVLNDLQAALDALDTVDTSDATALQSALDDLSVALADARARTDYAGDLAAIQETLDALDVRVDFANDPASVTGTALETLREGLGRHFDPSSTYYDTVTARVTALLSGLTADILIDEVSRLITDELPSAGTDLTTALNALQTDLDGFVAADKTDATALQTAVDALAASLATALARTDYTAPLADVTAILERLAVRVDFAADPTDARTDAAALEALQDSLGYVVDLSSSEWAAVTSDLGPELTLDAINGLIADAEALITEESATASTSLQAVLTTLQTEIDDYETAAAGTDQAAIDAAITDLAAALDTAVARNDFDARQFNTQDIYKVYDNNQLHVVLTNTDPAAGVIHGTDGADLINHPDGLSLGKLKDLGNDIFGGAGNDTIYGGLNADWIYGEAGNDVLHAVDGNNNMLDGGSGADILYGSDGSADIAARKGSDWLVGGAGNDVLYGKRGKDILDGGAGTDTLEGGLDADTYILRRSDGQNNQIIESATESEEYADYDVLEFGADIEISDVQIQRVGGDLLVTVLDGTGAPEASIKLLNWYNVHNRVEILRFSDGLEIEIGNFASFIVGTAGDDTLIGTNARDFIHGGDGDDEIKALGGDDVAVGGGGNDAVYGGTGQDLVVGSNGDDFLSGGGEADVVSGDSGNDILRGNDGNDNLAGGTGDDVIVTGTGNDRILFGFGDGHDIVFDEFTGAPVLVYQDLNNEDSILGAYQGSYTQADVFTAIDGVDENGNAITTYEIKDGFYVERYDTGTDDTNGDDIYATKIWSFDVTGASNTDAGLDRLEFKLGVSIDNIRIDRIVDANGPDELVLLLDSHGGSPRSNDEIDDNVRIQDWFGGAGVGKSIELFEFGAQNVVQADQFTFIDGTDGADTLTGGAGQDWITGGPGHDSLIGHGGSDILNGGDGNDTLKGGEGSGDNVNPGDTLIGGIGYDVLDYSDSWANSAQWRQDQFDIEGVYVNLGTGEAIGAAAHNDIFRGIEGIFGSDHDDLLVGNDLDNEFDGNEGNDTLSGGYGDDSYTFNLGDGQDVIRERNEDNPTSGDQDSHGDADTLFLGEGIYLNDISLSKSINPANGFENLVITIGEDGDQVTVQNWFLEGADKLDYLTLSDGHAIHLQRLNNLNGDVNVATDIQDWLVGTTGDDTLAGLDGDDILTGEGGDDLLQGDGGFDSLYGGAGADTLDGGDGVDFALYNGSPHVGWGYGVTVNLNEGYGLWGDAEGDTFIGIENVVGSSHNDIITGSAVNNDLYGADGNDTLAGVGGANKLFGGKGNDQLTGAGLSDTIAGEWGDDLISGGADGDELYGGDGADTVHGDDGNDHVLGQAGDDVLLGGIGNDTLDGATGDDSLQGDAGDDILFGNAGQDELEGGAGNDSLYGGRDDDTLYGGSGDDRYYIHRDYGHDVIHEHTQAGAVDRLIFVDDITYQELWLSQSGDDLVVEVIGEDQSVTVTDWFAADEVDRRSVRTIEVSGFALYREEVSLLLDKMAVETKPADTDTALPQTVLDAMNAYWHEGGKTPPVAQNLSLGGFEDTLFAGHIPATDIDDNIVSYTVVEGSEPEHGRLWLTEGTGQFHYLPDPDYYGVDSFTVMVTDADGQTAQSVVDITVADVVDTPLAGDLVLYTLEDRATETHAFNQDISGLTGAITYSVSGATYESATDTYKTATGTVALNVDGSFVYTPDEGFVSNVESFYIIATDENGATVDMDVAVKVFAVNNVPDSNTISLATREDQPQLGFLPDGGLSGDLIYHVITPPTKGELAIDDDTGAYLFLPYENENGDDSFTIRVDDGVGGTTDIVVPISILPVNDLPIGSNLYITTPEDTEVTGQVSATDPDGDPLTFSLGTPEAEHGTATLTGQDSVAGTADFSYTPDADFFGDDNFAVEVYDGQGSTQSAAISVYINVTAVNDAPNVTNTIAINAVEDMPINGKIFVNDPDGDTNLTYTVKTPVAHGIVSVNATTGVFTYAPEANYEGPDSFVVEVDDNNGGVTQATIELNVAPVADAPVDMKVLDPVDNQTQIHDASIDENIAGAVLGRVTATDPDGTAITYSVDDTRFEALNDGTLKLVDGESLNHEEQKNVTLTLTATDADGDTAQIQFTVNAQDVNEAPIVDSVTRTATDEDTPLGETPLGEPNSLTAVFLDADDEDEGHVLTYSVWGEPLPDNDNDNDNEWVSSIGTDIKVSHGEVVIMDDPGHFIYRPAADYSGTDNFTVRVTDEHGAFFDKEVTITVNPVNDAPSKPNNKTGNIAENTFGSIAIGGSTDVDGDPRFYKLANHGTLFEIVENTTLKLKNKLDFESLPAVFDANGQITVHYYAEDPSGEKSPNATVTVTIQDVDEAPTGVTVSNTSIAEMAPGSSTGIGSTVATVTVEDPDGDDQDGTSHSFSLSSVPSNAFAIDANTGVITVNGALDFETKSSYTMTLTVKDKDDTNLTYSEDITINVTNVNEAPLVKPNQDFQIPEHSRLEDSDIGETVDDDTDVGDDVGRVKVMLEPGGSYGYVTGNDTNNYQFRIIDGQDTRQVFDIDNSGNITVHDDIPLDYEHHTTIPLMIQAFDGEFWSDPIQVDINLEDLDDGDQLIYATNSHDPNITPWFVHEDYGYNFEQVEWNGQVTGATNFSVYKIDPFTAITFGVNAIEEGYTSTYTEPGWGEPFSVHKTIPSADAIPIDDGINTGSGFDDTLTGSSANNTLTGFGGDDVLNALGGDDVLYGDEGSDSLVGGDGDDTLDGGAGNDTLRGGDHNDLLYGRAGNDVLDGQSGTDTADYGSAVTGVVANLTTGSANDGEGFVDTLIAIENLYGSNHNDSLTGNSASNHLQGRAGADTLMGGAGADTLDGGSGTDYASYESAASAIKVDLGNLAANTGDAAGDSYVSVERYRGSAYNDTFVWCERQ